MGEEQKDRAGLLLELANLPEHPESVPINMLVKIAGTPMEKEADLDDFEFIRTIAVARIMMPKSHVRLSAGRENMNDQMQALAFMAGANSIFYCDKLLTTPNPKANNDMALLDRLGISPEPYQQQQSDAELGEQLRQQVAEELLRRTAERNAVVPIDRDPVPDVYAEQVRRYYEQLGSGE